MKIIKNIYFLPAVITLILLSLLFSEQISEKTALPSEDWSRSILLEEFGESRTLFIQEDEKNEQFHIFTPKDKSVLKLIVNNTLKIESSKEIPLQIHKRKPFWANLKNDIIYLNDNNHLILNKYEDGEETLIEHVNGLSTHRSLIVTWKGNNIYTIDPTTFEVTIVATTNNIVNHVHIEKQSGSLLARLGDDGSKLDIAYFKQNGEQYESVLTGIVTSHMDSVIADLDFFEYNNELQFAYTAISRRQGVRKMKSIYLKVPFDESAEREKLNLAIVDTNNPMRLNEPVNFHFRMINNEPTLLFAARGRVDKRTIETSVFEAKYNEEQNLWKAERRSSTYNMSLRPQYVNENIIVWLDLIPQATFSKEEYQILSATSDIDVVRASQEISFSDIAKSLGDMLTSLPRSIFILFFAFVWIVPPVLLFFVLAVANPNKMEEKSLSLRLISIGLLVFTQYFVMNNIKDFTMQLIAPAYLTIPNNMLVYTLVMAVVSYVVLMVVKDEDWSPPAEFIYFTIINAWFISLLFGSYLI